MNPLIMALMGMQPGRNMGQRTGGAAGPGGPGPGDVNGTFPAPPPTPHQQRPQEIPPFDTSRFNFIGRMPGITEDMIPKGKPNDLMNPNGFYSFDKAPGLRQGLYVPNVGPTDS
jgi:hypothetical protein